MTSKICGIKIIAFMPWKQRWRPVLSNALSNITKMFWKCVLSEWIRKVIIPSVFEWFVGINFIFLRSQIPILPLRWHVKTKFVTVKWYNLCLQIIQSQMCYPLISKATVTVIFIAKKFWTRLKFFARDRVRHIHAGQKFQGHKNIRVSRLETIFFFLILFFINELMLNES